MFKTKVTHDFGDRNVCIIGLGYVGLTLAVSMAEVGFKVWGVEKLKDVVTQLSEEEFVFISTLFRSSLLSLCTFSSRILVFFRKCGELVGFCSYFWLLLKKSHRQSSFR